MSTVKQSFVLNPETEEVTRISHRDQDPASLIRGHGTRKTGTTDVATFLDSLQRIQTATSTAMGNFFVPQKEEYTLLAHWIQQNGNETFLYQYPPGIYPIFVRRNSETFLYHLAFPYIILTLHRRGRGSLFVCAYYRNKPITSWDDYVHKTNLSNMHYYSHPGTSSVCMSSAPADLPLKQQLERTLELFWETVFTGSLQQFYQKKSARYKFPSDYENWRTRTKRNPRFVLNLPWPRMHTIRQILIGNNEPVAEADILKSAFTLAKQLE